MKNLLSSKQYKFVSPIVLFISSLAFIAMGTIILLDQNKGIFILFKIIKIFLLIQGIIFISLYIFNIEQKRPSKLIEGILSTSLFLIFKYFPDFVLSAFIYIVAIWMIINFLWRVVFCIILKINNDKEFLFSIIECVVYLILSVLILISPTIGQTFIFIIIGIYMILHAINLFRDFIDEVLKLDSNFKRKIKIQVPVLFTAFIPYKIMNLINNKLESSEIPKTIEIKKDINKNAETELEIFIHMAPQIAFGFGHCDICFQNTLYSYGNYDSDSNKIGGIISDGVFVEMERQKYIEHCLKIDNEKIVGFSIYLTEQQKKDMKSFIEEFKKNTYRWKCKQEINPQNDYNDSASIFYKDSNARFYKFNSCKFKTYFALKTNCIQLADTLVGSSGIGLIDFNGIITPGAYYKYLDERFALKNSFVTKKSIYVH